MLLTTMIPPLPPRNLPPLLVKADILTLPRALLLHERITPANLDPPLLLPLMTTTHTEPRHPAVSL